MNTLTKENTGKSNWMGIGAIFAGIAASLCCTLPILATFFGFSLFAGASAFFEDLRPYFLIGASVLLAYGYYTAFKKPQDEDIDCECDNEDEKKKKHFKLMLYAMTLVTFAFAFYPQYSNQSDSVVAGIENKKISKLAILDITGMTCDGCASSIHTAVIALNGILKADVSYQTKTAIIYFGENSPSGENEVRDAITNIGFGISKFDWK